MNFLDRIFLLRKDGLYPCSFGNLEYVETLCDLLLYGASGSMNAACWQLCCAYLEARLDDVANGKCNRVPAASEVAVDKLEKHSCGDVTDVLVTEVCDAFDCFSADCHTSFLRFAMRQFCPTSALVFCCFALVFRVVVYYFESKPYGVEKL